MLDLCYTNNMKLLILALALLTTGCASNNTSEYSPASSSNKQVIRDTNGTTTAVVQNGRILSTNGATIAYIRGSNVYSTSGNRIANFRAK